MHFLFSVLGFPSVRKKAAECQDDVKKQLEDCREAAGGCNDKIGDGTKKVTKARQQGVKIGKKE